MLRELEQHCRRPPCPRDPKTRADRTGLVRQDPNFHLARVSNGPTEALNNLIKRVKRIGFGFRNFLHGEITEDNSHVTPAEFEATSCRQRITFLRRLPNNPSSHGTRAGSVRSLVLIGSWASQPEFAPGSGPSLSARKASAKVSLVAIRHVLGR
jgi:Transposase